jgi:hypothetical protein
LPDLRQAVTLLAAAGNVRQGHLDHSRGECRSQVRLPEVFFAPQPERGLDLLPGHLSDHPAQQAFDFPCDFPSVGCRDEGQGMARQPDHEREAVVVRLEQRRRRAIGGHRLQDFRDARRAAFGQVQLLQELADAPIAVAAADSSAGLKIPGSLAGPRRS